MKISLNWLKKYVDINVSTDDLIRLIGARLVEVEDVIDESKKYDKIFVVKVVSCEPIEGTHLHLCQIDAGGDLIQVVCGAPNVRAGMLAAWIAPGATVPASVHDDAPFIIGTRKMLGKYESHGMLAGADELDFGDDHSGIVEIDPNLAKPGDLLLDIFELNDIILDIENKSLTHRPDCFGIIGFAREVAGILGQKFIEPEIVKSIEDAHAELVSMLDSENSCPLIIQVADSEICPYYSAAVLDFTRVPTEKKYLTWQDTMLSKSGMRPISPIVDLTNYLMLLTGQPLHAFDYDKFVSLGQKPTAKIGVRLAKKGEKLLLLDDKEIELKDHDIIITSGDKPAALAGAMGGKETEIDERTQKIILESATFSLYNLRKTQMAHGIFSEAITRFTKGQPLSNCLPVLAAASKELGGKILALAMDHAEAIAKKGKIEDKIIEITVPEINTLLGTAYTKSQIIETLSNVDFQNIDSENLCLKVPSYRTDISIKEDIIEEVGRLLGYDNITPTLPLHSTVSKNPMLEFKKTIREKLFAMHAHELLTYSFVHGDLIEKVGQKTANSYKIVNSISPDLQYIRQTIVPSLLSKSYENLKSKHKAFALFEMNQIFAKNLGVDEDGVPVPEIHLAFTLAEEKGNNKYYQAKFYLERLMQELGIAFELAPAKDLSNYYEPKRSATILVNNEKVGELGEIKNSVARALKLPLGTAAFEIDLEKIISARTVQKPNLAMNEFPSISRDLTVVSNEPHNIIEQKIAQSLENKNLIFEIQPVSIYQPENSKEKSTSFHLEIASKVKTLDSREAQEILAELEKVCNTK